MGGVGVTHLVLQQIELVQAWALAERREERSDALAHERRSLQAENGKEGPARERASEGAGAREGDEIEAEIQRGEERTEREPVRKQSYDVGAEVVPA
mmetsp:Transcript_20602/g.41856  ORF Transcript_20602/g.41856 Transcript_20602/m.41856 type:complete len:97 (+) Transcript_20602:299-589(+)